MLVLALSAAGCGEEARGVCQGEPALTPCPRADGNEGYCWRDLCCESTFDGTTGDLWVDCE